MDDLASPDATLNEKKRAYDKPTLVEYGDVTRLTQTGSGSFADNRQKNCNHGRPNTNRACGSLG